jgi:hypothetical protein
MAIRELTRLLELTAKLTGELDERAQHNELHVHLPPDRALAVANCFSWARRSSACAKTYLDRHGAGDANSGCVEFAGHGKGVELIQPSGGNPAAVSKPSEEDSGNGTGT